MTDKTWTKMDAEVAAKGFALGECRGEIYARTRVRGWDLLMSTQGDGSTLVQKPGAPDPEYTAANYGAAVEWVMKKGDYAPIHKDDAIDDLLDDLQMIAQAVDQHEFGLPIRPGMGYPYSEGHRALRKAVQKFLEKQGLSVEMNDETSELVIPAAPRPQVIGFISTQALASLRSTNTNAIGARITKISPARGSYHRVYLDEEKCTAGS